MKPNPGRAVSRLGGVAGLLMAFGEIVIGGSQTDIIVSWCGLGLGAAAIAAWALIHKHGSDHDREEFPVGRQLVRQMRDDLRPVKLFVGHTWRNMGGW